MRHIFHRNFQVSLQQHNQVTRRVQLETALAKILSSLEHFAGYDEAILDCGKLKLFVAPLKAIRYSVSIQPKGGFLLSRIFSVRTDVNLTRVNKIETLYGMSGVYVKVEPRVAFHTPLFHLRTSILRALIARKNYATVEINPQVEVG